MTRIGNVDQIMVLLRQQLQRMEKARGKQGSGKPGAAGRSDRRSAADRVMPLARLDDLDQRDLERALIRALLADELGGGVAEDHRFERIAGEVHRLIQSDERTGKLLAAAIRQARAGS